MSNLNFEIFLVQPDQTFVKLDCDNLDMVTTVSISDVSDISTKRDNISQNIKLKGTKTNNKALGNPFNSSRFVDNSLTSTIDSNLSLNRKMECVVFENSVQIIKGYLKLTNATKANGEYTYDCIITGNIINFFSELGDKYLSDLSFAEYSHTYSVSNIQSTWALPMGSGYTYPFINYGDKSSASSADVNKIHINNFRPAIYAKEYINKIFKQPTLTGFTYEIRGTSDFKAEINSLLIPNDNESFIQNTTGSTVITLSNSGTVTTANSFAETNRLYKVIDFPTVTDPRNFIDENGTAWRGHTSNLFTWNRDITSDMKITLTAQVTNNNSNPIKCSIRFMERDASTDTNYDTFSLVEETIIATVLGNSSINQPVTLIVPQRLFSKGKQVMVAFYAEGSGVSFTSGSFNFNLTNATLVTPSVPTNTVQYAVVNGDTVQPITVSNVKQKDFIKSFCLLYNLYTYSTLETPKHIIFESFNDFYSGAKGGQVTNTAIDWTSKVDNGSDLVVGSFNDTAKKYSFLYKADSDYWNSTYTTKYGEVYGQYLEDDSTGNGVNDEKKIELIFSPTPLVTYNNSTRLNPEIYKLNSDGSRTIVKTNIRILYNNGLKTCTPYQIGNMSSSMSFTPIGSAFTSYLQVGHLRFEAGLTNFNYISDLNFGRCKEYYFLANTAFYSVPNIYTRLYQDQIREYADLNTTLFECDVLLNPVDISNLDLKTPVMINGADGNAFYKVLKVDYCNAIEPSTVQLQKIIIR